MKSDFLLAVTQLAAERGLPKESVVAAVEAALASAYKKDSFAAGHDITVRLDPNNGEIRVFEQMTVVEEVTDPKQEISLAEARKGNAQAVVGDIVENEAHFPSAGRIAAQTAKQVVLQRLREAERDLVIAEFASRVGELIAGRIERVEAQHVVVSVGRAEAIMPKDEQVPSERYRPNLTMQFYLLEVAQSARGPEVILSRSHRDLLRRLFEREVPEIFNGVVEIKAIAREPGSRSKVAVSARQEGVDPVGSCVGLRGFRIQNIVNELQGENIDVIQWQDDPKALIANALNPAQVLKVDLDEVNKSGRAVVPDRQLSLAIGREGQNVRLAAKLTGWRLEIKSLSELEADEAEQPEAPEAVEVSAEAEVAVAELQEVTAAVAEVEEAPEAVEAAVAEIEGAPVAELIEVAAAEAEVSAAESEAPALSPEEELLLAQTQEPQEETAEVVVEAPALDDSAIWAVRTVREPSVLRFTEDIMPERGRRRDGPRRGKGKKGKAAGVAASANSGATPGPG
jgi:N utilization substance protein A